MLDKCHLASRFFHWESWVVNKYYSGYIFSLRHNKDKEDDNESIIILIKLMYKSIQHTPNLTVSMLGATQRNLNWEIQTDLTQTICNPRFTKAFWIRNFWFTFQASKSPFNVSDAHCWHCLIFRIDIFEKWNP
jgi:hypothetical protein